MLPRIVVPHYELILPSNGKKMTFRPFLVKEEKLLLMAAQTRELTDIISAMEQVIENCVIEPKDFKVLGSPAFDINFILLNLRIRSIGKMATAEYTCNNKVKDGTCGQEFTVSYNLENVATVETTLTKPIIWLSDNICVRMRPPRFSVVVNNAGPTGLSDYNVLCDAIESISTKNPETSHNFDEQTRAEQEEWIDSLPKESFDKMIVYLSGLPVFEIHKQHACPKCGTMHDINIKDLTSFF